MSHKGSACLKSPQPPANSFSKFHCSDSHSALDPTSGAGGLNGNPNCSLRSKKRAATGWTHRQHKQPRLIFVRWMQHKQLELRISVWHSRKRFQERDGETITRLLGGNFNLSAFKALKKKKKWEREIQRLQLRWRLLFRADKQKYFTPPKTVRQMNVGSPLLRH